jgi:ubiquinone/menaquinone biosynthesis C-methylase UbiE
MMPDRPFPHTDNPFYAREDVAARYNRARALPADVERQWGELLARQVGVRPSLSVDLGCGTGRFTHTLVSRFGGRVIGIDPSRPMLQSAMETLDGTGGVWFVQGRAEGVPLARGCADLVLMSMSYHHVVDKAAALASIRRVLRGGGVLCIRTCSVEALDSYLYQRFFPEARRFDERRFPTRAGLREEVERAGFRPRTFETVHQRVAEDLREYRERVALRAHSDLQAVTDEQFQEGLERFDSWCAGQPAKRPVFEDVDLFTFGTD